MSIIILPESLLFVKYSKLCDNSGLIFGARVGIPRIIGSIIAKNIKKRLNDKKQKKQKKKQGGGGRFARR